MLDQLRLRSTALVAGLVAALVLIAACAPQATPTPTPPKTEAATPAPAKVTTAPASPEATKPAATPAAKAKPTGEVTFAWPTLEEGIWDPSKSKPTLRKLGGPMFDSLYRHYPPNGEVRPYLLQKGEMAADALSWTLTLKDGIRYSNGDPMTADDIKFSLERYVSKESLSTQATTFRAGIKSMDVVDRLTIRLNLNTPMIALPTMLAGSMGNEGVVLPKKYIEQVGWEGFERNPIGSGPYKRTAYKPADSITYEPVENPWGPTASFAKINVMAVPDEQSRVAMLLSGQADQIDISPDSVARVKQAGFTVKSVPSANEWHINLMGTHPLTYGQAAPPPTSKLEVRKALNLAIDKKELLNALAGGAGELTAVVPSVPGFTLGAPPKDWQPTPYDPAEAKRLLQQAGYPNGFTINFYNVNIAACLNYQREAEAIAGYWEQIGVKTNIIPMEYAVYRPMYLATPLDPKLVGAVQNHCSPTAAIAPRDLQVYWYSKGFLKLTTVADAEIENALNAKTNADLVQYSQAAYKKIYDDYSGVPLFFADIVYGVSKKMADVPVTRGFEGMNVWLVQEKP